MERLTVKEFAARAGVSTQAIYARLASPEFAKFVQVVQGKKTISSAALSLFSDKQDKQKNCKESNQVAQADLTGSLLLALEKQLEEKDKQIAELNNRLAEVTAALLNEQKSAQAAQALHAGTMQRELLETRTGGAEDAQQPEKQRKGWKWWRR